MKTLLLCCLFIFSRGITYAQTPDIQPFTHVINRIREDDGRETYDARVIDWTSGGVLHSIENRFYDCPNTLSPDGRWFIYGTSDNNIHHQEYTLVDLATGDETVFTQGSIQPIHWQDNFFFYVQRNHLGNGDVNTTIYRYDTEQSIHHDLERIESPQIISSMRWWDDDIVFLIFDWETVIVHRKQDTLHSIRLPARPNGPPMLSPTTRYFSYDWYVQETGIRRGVIFDTVMESSYLLDMEKFVRFYWFNQSDKVAYIDSEKNLATYDARTGESQVYEIALDAQYIDVQLSSDDRYLAYYPILVYEPIENPLRIIDLISGEVTEFGGYTTSEASAMRWLDDTHLVYVERLVEGAGETFKKYTDLWIYDVTTGEATQLTDTPNINEILTCGFG